MNKNEKDNLYYIDSLEAYDLALQFYRPNKDLLITDNTFISNSSKIQNDIVDISELLSQEKGNKIGEVTLSLCNDVENIFIKKNYNNIFYYLSSKIGLYLAIRSMISTTIEKSLIISLFLKNYSIKKIYFFINKSSYYDEVNPWLFPRFSNIYKFLAKKAFFGNIPYEIKELDINIPNNINDTRERNIFFRTFTWPLSYILYRFFSFFKFFINIKKDIYYIKTCETLHETLARFYFRGYRISSLKLPKKDEKIIENDEEKRVLLSNDIDPILQKYLSDIFSSQSEINSQKEIIIDHILLGLLKLGNDTKIYTKYFSELGPIKNILTAGFYGPIANQIFYLCKKHQIKLIGFEHGVTAGINKATSTYIEQLESTTCDFLMVSNIAAKKEFDKGNLSNEESKYNKVYVIGEAEQKKRLYYYKLQRLFLNYKYSITRTDTTIIHVSGILYSGNLKNSPYSPVNNYAFSREKSLLTKVYNKIDKKVFYKKYPSQRMIYQPCFSEILNLPNNISILGDADFRYVRTIADIIVTDSNYSTLGWCLIKEIPLIYLMSKKCNPLISDQLEDLFIESFFVVDCDLNGWELKLKQLLDIPMKNLQIKWNEKKAKRASLVKKYIHGPNHNSSIIAANYIERHL